MKDMMGMLRQAQEMQQKMQDAQARLEAMELTGRAGGDAVSVTMNGKGAVKRVSIAPEALGDASVLEDLMMAAFNNARVQAESAAAQAMQDAMGPLAGMAGGGLGGLLGR